jgi:hypothetical protein
VTTDTRDPVVELAVRAWDAGWDAAIAELARLGLLTEPNARIVAEATRAAKLLYRADPPPLVELMGELSTARVT